MCVYNVFLAYDRNVTVNIITKQMCLIMDMTYYIVLHIIVNL